MALDQIETFMAAIRQLESGSHKGNYDAVGPYTGKMGNGLGAYQIMSANWDSWAAQAGIPGANWRSKAAQDRVATFKFRQYYQQYGRWDAVAVAWFAGPGRVDDYLRDAGSTANIKDVTGTSVPSYVKIVQDNMKKLESIYGDPEAAAKAALLKEKAAAAGHPQDQDPAEAQTPEAGTIFAHGPVGADVEELLGETPVEQQAPDNPGNLLASLFESVADRIAGGSRLGVHELDQVVTDGGEDDTATPEPDQDIEAV